MEHDKPPTALRRGLKLFLGLALANALLLAMAAPVYNTSWGLVPSAAVLVVNAPAIVVSAVLLGDEQDERFGLLLESVMLWTLSLPVFAAAAYLWVVFRPEAA